MAESKKDEKTPIEPKKDELTSIDNMEIEPLSDDALESVAGGSSTGPSCCSCSNCSRPALQ